MAHRLIVKKGTYYDSVTLMLASRDAEAVAGVAFAAAVAATPVNTGLLAGQGFDLSGRDLGRDDLVVAIRAEGEAAADAAAAAVEARLGGRGEREQGAAEEPAPRSFRSAVRRRSDLSLAFVSVPGAHAAYEVATALDAGLDVFCFSDGLSVQAEAALKRRAVEQGLLLMGPDCGTALIDGVALGFANAVERGPIGVIGASGTGIQQVTCLLDAAGVGVSHALGVGGRDLQRAVGGIMTLRALELLATDERTEAIVVISKPPDPSVASTVAEAAGRAGLPVVLGFLGRRAGGIEVPEGVELTTSLEESAALAAAHAGGRVETHDAPTPPEVSPGSIRGLFCGGSLCYEAMAVVSDAVGPVASNVPLTPDWRLDEVHSSRGHTFIDFGEDDLTEGRAHPMIDPSLRNERFEKEAAQQEVGAIVLDVVLGYGAHHDPAAGLARVVEEVVAHRAGGLSVIAAVCGTAGDPQDVTAQAARLREAGAIVTRSAAHAGRLALAAIGAGP